ncbi:tumor protein [Tyrophagus putrescentiae]|nr:tumor protein [Tyrophagus putrescentiae]
MGAGLSGVGGGGGSLGSSPVNPMLNRIKYFFASRSSTFDDIWNVCANLSEEIGEQVLDVFCLTLIDHWDKEKERYVLLCERCLITLEYDFERLELRTLHLFDYSRFDTIRIGPLCYPEMSFNSISHRYQLAMRFGWDSTKPLNTWSQWNPWSRDIPWITLTSHPLKAAIDELLETSRTELDDTYFSLDYLLQIRRRYSIEMFHDKLFEILNSFQASSFRRNVEIPSMVNYYYPNMYPNSPRPSSRATTASGGHHATGPMSVSAISGMYSPPPMLQQHQLMRSNIYGQLSSNIIELYHPDHNMTIVHYAPIICENYFNLPAAIFNRTRLGYYRLRLF